MAGFALTFVIAGCTGDGGGSADASGGGGEGAYHIGVSNTLTNNGWREEMICAIKAQALASGEVAELNIAHRNTDAAGQLEDIRNLIAQDVNAIVVNPADRAGIGDALAEATEAGIIVVAVDQAVTEASAYVMSNNQEQYAYLGAKWLFEKMGGKGDVVYMRGAAGASADSDRDKGFKRALAENPDVNVIFESQHRLAAGQGQAADPRLHRHRRPLRRHLDLGHRQRDRRRAGRGRCPLVPVVGADNAGFVGSCSVEGLVGAAVTNPRPSAAPA